MSVQNRQLKKPAEVKQSYLIAIYSVIILAVIVITVLTT